MKTLCIDASVFLNILLPSQSRTSDRNIEASERIIDLIQQEKVSAIAPAIVIAEIKWAVARAGRNLPRTALDERLDEIDSLFPYALGKSFRVVNIDIQLASHAADLCLKYYSRTNAFSYNDALYLATSLLQNADFLITTDQHLLKVKEIMALEPAGLVEWRRRG